MDGREEGRNGESRRTPFLSIGSNKPRLWGAEGGGALGQDGGWQERKGTWRGGCRSSAQRAFSPCQLLPLLLPVC